MIRTSKYHDITTSIITLRILCHSHRISFDSMFLCDVLPPLWYNWTKYLRFVECLTAKSTAVAESMRCCSGFNKNQTNFGKDNDLALNELMMILIESRYHCEAVSSIYSMHFLPLLNIQYEHWIFLSFR